MNTRVWIGGNRWETHAVSEAMREVLLESMLPDYFACSEVHVGGANAGPDHLVCSLGCFRDGHEYFLLPVGRFADHLGAGDVGPVAVRIGIAVDEHHVSTFHLTIARVSKRCAGFRGV